MDINYININIIHLVKVFSCSMFSSCDGFADGMIPISERNCVYMDIICVTQYQRIDPDSKGHRFEYQAIGTSESVEIIYSTLT